MFSGYPTYRGIIDDAVTGRIGVVGAAPRGRPGADEATYRYSKSGQARGPAPTKPSGIEWLGEVPEHWKVKPLKRWVRLNASTLGEKTDPHFEFRYVDIGSVQTGRLAKELERIRFEAAPSRARRVLRRGDTIISTVRTYLKAIWYVSEDADDLIASTGFAVLTPGSGVEPEYLGYVIQSSAFVNRVTANSIGIAYPAIAETVLGRFPVALPTTVAEQQAIVAHIKTESAPLDEAIASAEDEIKLIREYRDRLIRAALGGQRQEQHHCHAIPAREGGARQMRRPWPCFLSMRPNDTYGARCRTLASVLSIRNQFMEERSCWNRLLT